MAISSGVIPAKAGIYLASLQKCAGDGLDSRFRGNDRGFERDPILNNTTTQERAEQFVIRNVQLAESPATVCGRLPLFPIYHLPFAPYPIVRY